MDPAAKVYEENLRLRRTMRDLVALTTLPAVWIGLTPEEIVRSLVDVLLSTLDLDLVYVRLAGPGGGHVIEVARSKDRARALDIQEIRALFAPHLKAGGVDSPISIQHPAGTGSLHVAITRFGVGDDQGVLVAASQNPTFPTEQDRLLLGVGANQTAIVVQRRVADKQREEAEEDLRSSEAELGDFFDNATIGLHWAAPDGTILRVNQAELDMLGYSRDEYVGRPMSDFHVDQEVIDDILTRLQQGENLEEYPARLRCKDGSIKDVLIDSSVLWKDGEFIHTRCFTRDITERKRAESNFRDSAQRLQLALSAGRLGDWSWDASSDIVRCGPRTEEIFGLAPGEKITWSQLRDRLHVDDRERARVAVETALGKQTDYDIEYRLAHPTGEPRWIAAKGRGMYSPDGDPIGMIGVVQDITERKQFEETRFRLAAIVESSDDVIVSKTLDGIIKSWNAGAQRIFGYTAEEAIGRSILMLIPPERHNEEETILSRLKRGERIDHFETVRLRKDGTPIHVSLTVSPVKDSSGRIIGASKIARDITAQKQAAAEREALLEAERAARAQAERASILKDEFLATVSHELRTPLSAILGWSQVMSAGDASSDDVREGLEAIQRNARAQAQLIEDLLDMSRIISGKVRLDVQSTDLASVVEAAVESARPAAEAKEIRLRKVIDPLAGPVMGDPTRLQQVVWNLLTNAIKFTPKGGKVDVFVERVNSHLEITVHDTGQGIKPDFLPYVFERFRQADASTTRSYGGLGIGLSIVKNLVELHGGIVRAKSPGEGQGATFVVNLPIAPVKDGDKREHPSTPSQPSLDYKQLDLSGVKVLVVDDELDARELLSRVLTQCGAKVQTAASAKEGLKLISDFKPDVLVSDIGMPNMDGYSFIREVRLLPADIGGKTPAIAVTAFARAEDRTRAMLAGYQLHISKPLEPHELVATVGSLAGRTLALASEALDRRDITETAKGNEL